MGIRVYKLGSGSTCDELSISQNDNSLDDISRQLPQGLYSTFRTYGNGKKVLGLQAHLCRLYEPSEDLGILASVSKHELCDRLRLLLIDYQLTEARVRISLSLSDQAGAVYIMLEPLKLLDKKIYQEGVKLVTSQIGRALPRLKSTGFIEISKKERKGIEQNGIFEGLIVHKDRILEGFTSNFYAVKNKEIITARYGILLGVTRRAVLRVARTKGLEINYHPLELRQIQSIDEAFITSSSRGVVPVVEIDGNAINGGSVGSIARLLKTAYDEYVLQKAEFI